MKVELRDVIEAIEDTDDAAAAFYDPETSEIIWDGNPDEQDLIALPGKEEREDYRNMERFIETVENEEAQDWLSNAIKGSGAFRRFRAACEKFHLLDDWYDYEDKAHRALAVQWCEDNGIVWEDNGRTEEVDEEDVSDFLHEDFKEKAPVIKEAPAPQPVQIRIVEITEKNLMNALYIADAYLQMMYHGHSDLDYAETQLHQWLKEKCHVISASDHGRFVGLAAGREDMDDFTVMAVYVTEDHRRRGIGRQMMDYFEDNHPDVSSYRLEINDKMTNAAQFFAAAGYCALPSIIMRKTPQEK